MKINSIPQVAFLRYFVAVVTQVTIQPRYKQEKDLYDHKQENDLYLVCFDGGIIYYEEIAITIAMEWRVGV